MLQTITSYAKDDGVQTLYRFVRYPPDGNAPAENREARRRVNDLLMRGELYFASGPNVYFPAVFTPEYERLRQPRLSLEAKARDALAWKNALREAASLT